MRAGVRFLPIANPPAPRIGERQAGLKTGFVERLRRSDHWKEDMNRQLLMVLALLPAVLSGQARKTIDWANFPVEMEKFIEGESGRYATVSTFNGVGNMYFSATKKVIDFKGLRS